jgi:toxin YoeB
MSLWTLEFTNQAKKDGKKLTGTPLQAKARTLLSILQANPYSNPPPDKKLTGDLKGAYSRRLNIQNRLVYQVIEEKRLIKILRMWSHYD